MIRTVRALAATARAHSPCSLHRYHWPPVLLAATEAHHPWPKYLGGPEHQVMAWVCGNCHTHTHLAITAMVEGLPIPKVTRAQYALARRGYLAWVNSQNPAITSMDEHRKWRALLIAA